MTSHRHSGTVRRTGPGISRFRVRRCASPRNDESVATCSELHARRGLDLGAAGAQVEEVLAGEAEHAGEQGGRHLLDAGVVFLDRIVEEAGASPRFCFWGWPALSRVVGSWG